MDASQLGFSDALCTYRANLAYRPYAVAKPVANRRLARGIHGRGGGVFGAQQPHQQRRFRLCHGRHPRRKDLEGDWQAYLDGLGAMGLARYLELTQLYITIG